MAGRVSGKSSKAKRVSKRRHAVSRFRGRRAKETETVSRVYSERWETKAVSPMVAYKPYTTEQTISGESTAIYSTKYNPERKILWITFWKTKIKEGKVVSRTKGSTYAYYKVPESMWVAFNEASSKGRYFWLFIRGQFNYSRVR